MLCVCVCCAMLCSRCLWFEFIFLRSNRSTYYHLLLQCNLFITSSLLFYVLLFAPFSKALGRIFFKKIVSISDPLQHSEKNQSIFVVEMISKRMHIQLNATQQFNTHKKNGNIKNKNQETKELFFSPQQKRTLRLNSLLN